MLLNDVFSANTAIYFIFAAFIIFFCFNLNFVIMNLFSKQNAEFIGRHIGPNERDTQTMLDVIGVSNMDELTGRTVPAAIRMDHSLRIPSGVSEAEYLAQLKETSLKNKLSRNYIGQGYYDTHTPSVILRNIFENPGWYTQYTPYQAEISQGRLESLINYQTVVSDLTGVAYHQCITAR